MAYHYASQKRGRPVNSILLGFGDFCVEQRIRIMDRLEESAARLREANTVDFAPDPKFSSANFFRWQFQNDTDKVEVRR